MANSKNLLKNNLVKSSAKKNDLVANNHDSIANRTQFFLEYFFLNHQLSNPHFLVAYSGGLDSSVLLHLLAGLRKHLSFTLSAMYVHHGLSANADTWASFCEKICANLNIPFQLAKVHVDKNSGLGVEASARNARYQAFNQTSADFVCLAQHQDDQAETLLLQLARGAGAKGLAGMAQVDVQRKLLRPLLYCSQAMLSAYAEQNRLQWIEDESNENLAYDRNFIRHEVLPALRKRYPAIAETLSRSAENLAEASTLMNDLAELDSKNTIELNQTLNLKNLAVLSKVRQVNVVRWWLTQHNLSMPSAQQLQQMLQQLLQAKSDAAIKIKVGQSLHLMRYQHYAYLVSEQAVQAPFNWLWYGEEQVLLPSGAHLTFTQKMGQGIVLQQGMKLRIKNREGGERFKAELGRPTRTLKHVLQASEMPPWQREQLPLIFMDETLVYIPNIGTCADMQAKANELGHVVTWLAKGEHAP